jgi:hypothetical protein
MWYLDRRKKSKCPAEKPSCSVCQRLNLTCEYRQKPAVDLPPEPQITPNAKSVEPRDMDVEVYLRMI